MKDHEKQAVKRYLELVETIWMTTIYDTSADLIQLRWWIGRLDNALLDYLAHTPKDNRKGQFKVTYLGPTSTQIDTAEPGKYDIDEFVRHVTKTLLSVYSKCTKCSPIGE